MQVHTVKPARMRVTHQKTGMIQTFQAITLFGAGDPKMMAGGISEALVTTMLGLTIAIPLVLLYDKKPDFRSMWTFRIDVNQMIAESVQVGGNDATFQNVWEKLIAIWNTKTLVVLNVPSIDTSVYVKIVDMPATIDEFRTEVGGRGYVDVTVVEPIG